MHTLSRPAKSRLCGVILAFAPIFTLLIASCTDPNTIGGPNIISTPGNSSGTALLTQRDRIINGFQLEPPQEGGMSSNVTFNGKPPAIDMHVYRRTELTTTASLTTIVYKVDVDTTLLSQRASVNIAERTVELMNILLPGAERRHFTMLEFIGRDSVQNKPFPTGKLRTNFYVEPLQLEENSIDLPSAVKVTTPGIGEVIERSKGVVVRWDSPITYDSTKGMFAEVVIVANVKDKYRTNNAPSVSMPTRSLIKRVPNGATSMSFSREELSGLPADYAAFAVNLYTIKSFRNNTATIMATTHSFVQAELK